ncbi:MAG: hypothetical protein CL932_11510 [Deltaproteobacteria bacterium]|nr:hypothetical protein [Deltaproteobacteria bacterium]
MTISWYVGASGSAFVRWPLCLKLNHCVRVFVSGPMLRACPTKEELELLRLLLPCCLGVCPHIWQV